MASNLVIKKEHIVEYNRLIEDCVATISELSFSQAMTEIEKRHKVGELIVTSTLYKKYEKGSGDFLDRVAKDLDRSRSWIYESVKFYEKYPDVSAFISGFNPEKKVIRWSDVRKTLPASQECEHPKTETETIEITRIRCIDCGKVLNEQKTKT
jgi:hypothetical protein